MSERRQDRTAQPNIRRVDFAPPPVCDDAVEMLQRWLDMAKAGELKAVACAGVKPCGGHSSEWAGQAGSSGALHSAAAVLEHRLIRARLGE